jgi:hypothetical protein
VNLCKDAAFSKSDVGVSMVAVPSFKDPDKDALRVAARRLGLSEIEFFRLAHDRWYGHPAPEKAIEQAFMDYLLHGREPHWVRHLIRQIGRNEPAGQDAASRAPVSYLNDTPGDPIQRAARIALPVVWLIIIVLVMIGVYR